MLEEYLILDRNGIVPTNLDSESSYSIRGHKFLRAKTDNKKEINEKVIHNYKNHNLYWGKASNLVYEFLDKRIGCDLRWVPVFYAKAHTKGIKSLDENNDRNTIGVCSPAGFNNMNHTFPVIIIDSNLGVIEKDRTSVHELIHGVRLQLEDLVLDKRGRVRSEVFADMLRKEKNHNEYNKNPKLAMNSIQKLSNTIDALRDTFGKEAAGYIAVRLKWNDVERIGSMWLFKDYRIKNYLKSRAMKSDDGSRLRFRIICERLGL